MGLFLFIAPSCQSVDPVDPAAKHTRWSGGRVRFTVRRQPH
jgi:hypothetical protein